MHFKRSCDVEVIFLVQLPDDILCTLHVAGVGLILLFADFSLFNVTNLCKLANLIHLFFLQIID